MALRLRRGTDAERQTITPQEGELIYTTDTKELYVGDGTTQGGNLVSAELLDDTAPTLGGNLNLNGNDIIGSGNINIDGTITASGNINLGDGAEDNVIVGGQIASHLIPKITKTYDLGSPASQWSNLYTSSLDVETTALISNLTITDSIYGDDSKIIYNAQTDSLSATNIDGNFTGSLFADDSTVIIDGINRSAALTSLDVTTIQTADLTIAQNYIISTADSGGVDDILEIGDRDRPNSVRVFSGTRTVEGIGATDTPEDAPSFETTKSRGTLNSPEALQTGDTVAYWLMWGYDGTGYDTVGGIDTSILEPVSPGQPMNGKVSILLGNLVNDPGNIKDFSFDYTGTLTVPGMVDGDLTGSVFADSSGMIIDGTTGSLMIANINMVGETGNTPSTPGSVDSWLEVTVNGVPKYIPLYS